ncbi:PucR family transcriptional regulator ligand-binding domain-containing protein [Herbiconiux sp. YIM B11900]|uniref:PucR family transcriptional regulator n=1 Tax=Herbiconiux sp. YIM B11900 TaxID=3404131 RepID=UPI003F864343
MPVTLSELLATPALNLVRLTAQVSTPAPGEAAADPELLWSHASDLDDPSPFLEPGQLLLTTGRQFSEYHVADEYHDYVGRLQRAGVVALGFGTEVLRVTPPELVDACDAAGMPLLEVPYATPFIAVSRQIADRLAAEARQQLEWTLVSQEAVSRAASTSGGLSAAVERAAAVLGCAVRVVDADGGLVEAADPPGESGAEPPGVRRRASELLGRGNRARDGGVDEATGRHWIVQTVGGTGRLRGAVAVIRPSAFGVAEESVLTVLTALTELSFEHAEDRRMGLRAIAEQFFQLLRDGRIDSVRKGLRSMPMRLPREPFSVIALTLAELGPGIRDAVERLAARPPQRLFAAADEQRLFLLADAVSLPAARALLAGAEVRAGESDPATWSQLDTAISQAGRSLDSAPAGQLLSFSRLVSENVFGLLASSQVSDIAHARLQRHLSGERGRRRLVEASVWLRHNGSWEPAARELGMHRHSLKARIGELSTELGLPLDTFQGRAELWVLLAAVEVG